MKTWMKTRKNSIRMRTVRCSGCCGWRGVCLGGGGCLPHHPAQYMLGYTPPAQCMLGYTPPWPVHAGIHIPLPSTCPVHTHPAQCMLGYTPPAQCMLGYTPPCPVHAGIHIPLPSTCWDTPTPHPHPVDRILDTYMLMKTLPFRNYCCGR